MTVQTQSRAGAPWWLVVLAVLFMLCSAAVRSYGIKDPWLQGHLGWSGYRSGNIARNYVRYGYADTRLGAVRNIGPLGPDQFVYDEHPPMIYWLASVGYQLFGLSEWSAALAPILCSALSVGLLFLLAYRWWGLAVAALASAFMVFVPMDAYYGRMVDHEAPTLLFALLSFYMYTLWKEKRSRGYFAALLGSLALAALSDFPGYFVGPWLALYHFLSEPRKSSWKASLVLLLSSPAFFLLWAAYLRWISGSFEILTARFSIRTGAWAPWVFTLGELYRTEYLRVQGLYTPTLLFLAGLWVVFMAWDVYHGQDLKRHGFVAMLGGFGMTYVALFHQNAYQHEFVAYYLTPFMCIAPAWAVVLLAGKLLSPRPAVVAVLAVIVFVPFLGEAREALRQLYAPREAAYVKVAQYLNGKLPGEGKVLASIEDSTRNQWLYYLDRPTLPVTDLGALEAKLRDPGNRYYVLDTRLSEATQDLRDDLARRYAAEVMGPFLIFDLRHEGPNLVSDRPPDAMQPVTGDQYHDPYLTLLGYSLPSELNWPQPSPSDPLLYSSSDYWPAGPDIPVQATLYWRCDQAVPEGYLPGVTLRGSYDQTYALQPVYAPQKAALPPQSWRPGDIVRTDYTFKIPRGSPDIRYDLSVSWPTPPGEAEAKAKTEWVPVAGAVVAPRAPFPPLAEAPAPQHPAESAPVAGLKYLGFDLSQGKAVPGGDVRLRTYWQALSGLEGDYALVARLQEGDYSYSQLLDIGPTRLWQPGKFYAADLDLSLPAGMLAGRYDLSLNVRGPSKGSVPLTTLEVAPDHQRGLVRRWGEANDAGGELKPLTPEEPLTLKFDLRAPRDLLLTVNWTGRAELDRTRVEADVVNDSWYAPRKHLTTWTIGKDTPQKTWVRIPQILTSSGSNTVELRVPRPPVESYPMSHPMGWRGVLDAVLPGVLQDPGAQESGALEIDFAQVSAVQPDGSWAEFRNLAETYAQRKMWAEVARVYQSARDQGVAPGSPEDLTLFLQAAQATGDADLKAQVESQLTGLIPHPSSTVLGDQVELIGYDVGQSAAGRAQVTLFFKALKAMPVDYTAWMHATPADPALLFGEARQAGHFTLDHRLPTSTWTPGGIYRDTYEAPLPAGDYDFSFGLWRWEDGSRLYRADKPAEHAVDLGRVGLR